MTKNLFREKNEMHMTRYTFALLFCAVLLAVVASGVAGVGGTGVQAEPAQDRISETLGRGVVAFRQGEGSYVGWRLLDSDPSNVGFNVYRRAADEDWQRLNEQPIWRSTNYVDEAVETGRDYEYQIRAVVSGQVRSRSRAVAAQPSSKEAAYVSIPLEGDYEVKKVGIGDLNGDGRYDFVIKQPNTNIDPWYKNWEPSQGTYKVEAYLHDGTFLWRKDLGWSIERGTWYSPMVVYDFNGDGRAEVALKTGEGDPRITAGENVNESELPWKVPVQGDPPVYEGKVVSGPEYVSVLDGLTGETISRTDWPSRAGYYKYSYAARNQMAVAYLDGKTPSLLVERGTYGPIKLDAYQLRDGELHKRWQWDSRDEGDPYYMRNANWGEQGPGAHSMHAADVDEDGRDEVFVGTAVVDDTGEGLWSLDLRHTDQHYVGEIMPWRDGLEAYYGIEKGNPQENGMSVVDARTGEILWGLDESTGHVHSSGLCADILPDYPGREFYGKDKQGEIPRLFSAKGKLISHRDMGYGIDAVWWDDDPQRELLLNGRIQSYAGEKYTGQLKGDLVATADVFGDWREELVTSHSGELRIYTTTIPSETRHVTHMQDPIYRLDVAMQAMGYLQTPMTSYFLAGEESFSRSRD